MPSRQQTTTVPEIKTNMPGLTCPVLNNSAPLAYRWIVPNRRIRSISAAVSLGNICSRRESIVAMTTPLGRCDTSATVMVRRSETIAARVAWTDSLVLGQQFRKRARQRHAQPTHYRHQLHLQRFD